MLKTTKTVALCCLGSFACFLHTRAQDIATIAQQKPVTLTGLLDFRIMGYNVNGIPERRNPFTFFVNGNPTLNIYGVAVPFSFTLSNQSREFRQPFNNFGLSPHYRKVTLHLGYRNLNFSPYTLAGHTMLGAGFEVNPGKFRAAFMYGRLNRATEIDTTTGVVQPYSFSRKGFATRLGYGDENRLFEVSLLSARDDSSSLKEIPGPLKTIAPAANAAGSFRTKYAISRKISIEADAGASLYTFNAGSDSAALPELSKLRTLLEPMIPVNNSTLMNFAYTASLVYRSGGLGLKLNYRHIDPEFQSMGAYYFQNDVEMITIMPSYTNPKGNVRFNGSLGFQKDNLKEQKASTTNRFIGSGNLSWDISKVFGLDANYMNFSANATPQVTMVNNKYLLAQTTHNMSLTPRLVLPGENLTHVLVGGYNLSTLVDNNADTKAFNEVTTAVSFLNYNLTFNRLALTVTTGGNYTQNEFSGMEQTLYGGTLGLARSLLGSKLQLSATGSYSKSDQPAGATIINGNFSAMYAVAKRHRFSLRYYMINNNPDDPALSAKFTEHTGELGYSISF